MHAGPLVARKEFIIAKGGWKDLNYGEDIELVSRVGFDVHVPVAVGINAYISAFIQIREKRYGGFKRLYRANIDLLRGSAVSIERQLINRSKRGFLFYVPARIAGFYRNRRSDNPSWINKATLVKAVTPRELGIPERFFAFTTTLYLLKRVRNGEEAIDARVLSLVDKPVYKAYLNTRESRIKYFKDLEALGKEYLPLVVKIAKL